jgi:hypothetical protein
MTVVNNYALSILVLRSQYYLLKLLFLHQVGPTGHVVHSDASRVRNVGALFLMLGWDRYGFHEKRVVTQYAKYVFFHLVGSIGHVVHFSASRMRNIDGLFFMLRKDRYGYPKSAPGHITPNLCFCSLWDLWVML